MREVIRRAAFIYLTVGVLLAIPVYFSYLAETPFVVIALARRHSTTTHVVASVLGLQYYALTGSVSRIVVWPWSTWRFIDGDYASAAQWLVPGFGDAAKVK